jgi:hypothetical protein
MEMTPLHPGQLKVLRVRATLMALALLVAVLASDLTWLAGNAAAVGAR